MCAHIGQNRDIYPPSIFRIHFDSYPLPLFRRFIVGAAIEKNFLFFSDSVIVLVWFWLSDYRLIVSIFNISIFTRFGYAWLSSSTRLIFARYSLSVLRYIFLVSISTCFGIADSTLWLFNSLSLLLVINKHLCLFKFVLCLFWLF